MTARAGSSRRSPALDDAAADHDLQRVVEVDGVGDPDPEPLAEDAEAAPGRLVAVLRAVHAVVAGDLAVGLQALAEERVRVGLRGRERRGPARLPEASASSDPGCGAVAGVLRRAVREIQADDLCPISGAAPVAPRYSRPPSTVPPPTPVPIVNITRSGQMKCPSSNASASAAHDASLST